jgi:hypothetical protein
MDVFEGGGYIVQYNAEATQNAYSAIAKGGADVCTCTSCKNFATQRMNAFPNEFLTCLQSFGIDSRKEDEAYQCGKDSTGLYIYGGWFHFVGGVVRGGQEIEVDGFRYWFSLPGQTPKPSDAFNAMPVAAIQFLTHLPWTISEPEPDLITPTQRPGFWRRIGAVLRAFR